MNTKRRLSLWLTLTLLWTAVLFAHSLMPATVSHSESMGVFRLVQRLLPFLTHHLLRKLGHFSGFAVLGALWMRTVTVKTRRRPLLPLFCGLLTALSDETIQRFVPGRSGEVRDVWIDFGGVLLGALLVFLLTRKEEPT